MPIRNYVACALSMQAVLKGRGFRVVANAVSLLELDRTYAEHKASFEKWKVENRKKALSTALEPKPVSGPENIDTILGDLLVDIKPMEFLMALMTMQMNDATFLPNVLANFQKVQSLCLLKSNTYFFNEFAIFCIVKQFLR
uniref:Uncharacterized protein n=1 Tax=Heterorhabditis bacteriophora TaxID=37862 RepID=A0A1I7XEW3_HETBA